MTNNQGLTGRHVLAAFLGFFGVIFAVNGYFLKAALSTYTGVVAVEPYRKGLKYNERIEAAHRQDALGWHDALSVASDGRSMTLTLRDRDGAPVRGLVVTGALGRPATVREDLILSFAETEPGHYETTLALGDRGAFIATLEARAGDDAGSDVLFRARKRLWLDR